MSRLTYKISFGLIVMALAACASAPNDRAPVNAGEQMHTTQVYFR